MSAPPPGYPSGGKGNETGSTGGPGDQKAGQPGEPSLASMHNISLLQCMPCEATPKSRGHDLGEVQASFLRHNKAEESLCVRPAYGQPVNQVNSDSTSAASDMLIRAH